MRHRVDATALQVQVDVAQAKIDPSEARQCLGVRAVLSEGGLRPALATLARRSAVPVEVTYDGPDRFEEPVEVAAYFIVSEALANVVKHASASGVAVDVDGGDAELVVTIRDDGVGGADVGSGTGLLGLRDRAAALGGRVTVASPVGGGTTVRVVLPLEPLDVSAGPALEKGADGVP